MTDTAKVHSGIAALARHYLETQQKEYDELVQKAWDDKAAELRPKSSAERRSVLETMRAELENDSDDPNDPEEAEINEEIINDFIRAMNERGVHFE